LAEHPLFGRLHADIAGLAADAGLRPDLLVVTGNLAERGLPVEFRAATAFIGALAEEAEIPRRHVAIVPGDHDVNRFSCQAYFLDEEGEGREPAPPYWPKWRQYEAAFREFYAGVGGVTFTPDEPWTLFEMPDLAVVVAGPANCATGPRRWVGDTRVSATGTDWRDRVTGALASVDTALPPPVAPQGPRGRQAAASSRNAHSRERHAWADTDGRDTDGFADQDDRSGLDFPGGGDRPSTWRGRALTTSTSPGCGT
jgi:hypothetical protein